MSEKSLEMRHFGVSPYSKEAELDPIGGNLGPLAPGGARPWPAQGRGRDSGYPLPPAQTRARGTTAHGSHLG